MVDFLKDDGGNPRVRAENGSVLDAQIEQFGLGALTIVKLSPDCGTIGIFVAHDTYEAAQLAQV